MKNPLATLFDRRSWSSVGGLENPSVDLARALTQEFETLTAAGVSLSPEKAANVSDVFPCIQVIAQDVGRCPLKLRVRREDGRHEDAIDHTLWELLHDLTNPEMTAYQFKQDMQRNLLTHSRAYAEIVRNPRGEVKSLWVLDPQQMRVTRDSLNRKVYTYRAGGRGEQTWTFDPSLPPILDLAHSSPLAQCRDLIGLAYALELFASKFFSNGARPSGTLELPVGATLEAEARDRMRRAFEKLYAGASNTGKVVLTEGGAKFNPITIPNNEAQFIETRKYVRTQIAGVFRVPPHKIGDLERATFSNIENQSIDYVTGTLDPFLVSWEQAIRRDLLSTRQYPRYEVVFDRGALIKADVKSLYDAFAVGRQNGWMSANDILRELGRNPISPDEGGDAYMVNGNMIPVARAGSQQSAAPTDKDDSV